MDKETSDGSSLTFEPYGTAGVTVMYSGSKQRRDLALDGKQYADKDADPANPETTSGKRLDAHHIQLESQVNGRSDTAEDLKSSEDGKTLTYISTVLKTSAVFTSVWDKK